MYLTPIIVVLDSGRRSESLLLYYANIHSTNANAIINVVMPIATIVDVTIQ